MHGETVKVMATCFECPLLHRKHADSLCAL